MKQIVVMSGKGGTGKTTITAALAQCAGDSAVVADCDVDASNLHLLLRPEVESEERFIGGRVPMFDSRGCSRCGLCASACAWSAIVFRNGQYEVDLLTCEGCAVCSHVCSDGIITMMPRVTGLSFTARNRFDQPMAFANLGIGQENSGKLVAHVKKQAEAMAAREGKKYVLVDGPPGIGCPAISAVSGAAEVLLVTEATQAGLHDLSRMIALLKRFNLQATCVINKADLDDATRKEIHLLCEEHNVPVVSELPWADLFPESLRQGRTLMEMKDAAISNGINSLWKHLQTKGDTE